MKIKYICQHPHCKHEAETYTYPYIHNEPEFSEWLCAEHAADRGFCYGCGYFCAGIEDYDFSPIEGLCGNCVDEFRYELGEYDDDYESYEYLGSIPYEDYPYDEED